MSFHRHIFVTHTLIAMKVNMGKWDKIIRIVTAIILGSLYFFGIVTGTLGAFLLVLAIVLMLTSLFGYCPLYTLVGLNTCKK